MRPTAHVSSAIILSFILLLSSMNTSSQLLEYLILSSFLIDIDYVLAPFFNTDNHREYPSHHPVLWSILFVLALIFSLDWLFYITIGGLFHLLLDTFDFGLPLSNTITTPWHLIPVDDTFTSEQDFVRHYWSQPLIVIFEALSYSIALLILLSTSQITTVLVISSFIFASGYSAIELYYFVIR